MLGFGKPNCFTFEDFRISVSRFDFRSRFCLGYARVGLSWGRKEARHDYSLGGRCGVYVFARQLGGRRGARGKWIPTDVESRSVFSGDLGIEERGSCTGAAARHVDL